MFGPRGFRELWNWSRRHGDDCCLLELDQDNWWKDGGKVLRSVHPSEDGRLRTVLVFSGGIYDEEGYYEAHLAVFQD